MVSISVNFPFRIDTLNIIIGIQILKKIIIWINILCLDFSRKA